MWSDRVLWILISADVNAIRWEFQKRAKTERTAGNAQQIICFYVSLICFVAFWKSINSLQRMLEQAAKHGLECVARRVAYLMKTFRQLWCLQLCAPKINKNWNKSGARNWKTCSRMRMARRCCANLISQCAMVCWDFFMAHNFKEEINFLLLYTHSTVSSAFYYVLIHNFELSNHFEWFWFFACFILNLSWLHFFRFSIRESH